MAPDWATRPLAAPVGTLPGAVVTPVTMVTEVSGSGVAVITVVGMVAVGPTDMVELETDQWKLEEAVELSTGATLEEVVKGSGVEATEVVEGSAGASEEDSGSGSAEVVGTAEEDLRGHSTAVGLHCVMVTKRVVVEVWVVVVRSSCAATRETPAAKRVARLEKRILAGA